MFGEVLSKDAKKSLGLLGKLKNFLLMNRKD